MCSCGRCMDEHDLRDYKCDFEVVLKVHRDYINNLSYSEYQAYKKRRLKSYLERR